MRETPRDLLNQILKGYAPYFNIREDITLSGLPVAAVAEFHSREERYVLVKSAQLWAAEHNEYAFFVLTDHLTRDLLQAYYQSVIHEGLRRIDPKKDHMCSYITLIVLADRIDPQAAQLLRKLKYYKSFLFTLRGYAHFRGAALELSTGKRFSNRLGKDVLKGLKKLL